MIDLICRKLLLGRAAKDWVDAQELDKILLSLSLNEDDAKEVTLFMKKYFLEVNSENESVRLNPWALKILSLQ